MMCKRKWLCWLIAPLLLFLPLLLIPRVMFFGSSDALFYANTLAMVTQSLKAGTLFARWLPDANAGFGSLAAIIVYAPLSYIVTAIINLPLAPLHMDIGSQLVIGMYASQVLCGYTSYLWLKRDFDAPVALAGSLLFVLLPYKLIYIYLHINLAQLWALALLPLWMCAAQDIARPGSRATGCYALAFAGVYYTHPLTLIAFGAVPAFFALWFGRRGLPGTLLRLGIAHAVGLGLCLMQAVPSYFYTQWIHAEQLLGGNYSWRNNFNHVDVYLCAYYAIIALQVGYAMRRIPSLKHSEAAERGFLWIAVLAGAWFLTQRFSTIVWELITPLQYLQFPAARLQAPALMAATYLICLWSSHEKEMKGLGSIAYSRGALAALILLFAGAIGYRVYQVETDPHPVSQAYVSDMWKAQITLTSIPGIYESRWNCIDAAHAFALYEHGLVPPQVAVVGGAAEISSVAWSPPQRIAFDADVRSPQATIAVRQCYVPLWRMEDEKGQDVPLAPGQDGTLIFSLPQGRHALSATLVLPLREKYARWVSLVSLLAALAMTGRRKIDRAQAPA